MGMTTNTTGHVRITSTRKLKYVFIVVPTAMVNLKAASTSRILKSDDTYEVKPIYASHPQNPKYWLKLPSES